jgi:hypothetical protein
LRLLDQLNWVPTWADLTTGCGLGDGCWSTPLIDFRTRFAVAASL